AHACSTRPTAADHAATPSRTHHPQTPLTHHADAQPRQASCKGHAHHQARSPNVTKHYEVSSAERQFGVAFPEEYHGFLLEVGAGGFGPGYGLASLACHEGPWGWPEWEAEDPAEQQQLARPFPSDEERARWTEQLQILENAAIAAGQSDDEEVHRVASAFRAAEDELHPAMTAGAVRLSHEGCGYYTWLVVTGEERGNLWFDARCVDEPLAPLWHRRRSRTRFAEWYLEWLDELQRAARHPGV
ncbi:hypothetical protein, partial [Streptomyces sp. NPDC021020]|uniref:hypothetical protein n=1 Tax=Streptomyces sp. NPDC021020 TaxID=3365109 RepID=UPI0037B907AE